MDRSTAIIARTGHTRPQQQRRFPALSLTCWTLFRASRETTGFAAALRLRILPVRCFDPLSISSRDIHGFAAAALLAATGLSLSFELSRATHTHTALLAALRLPVLRTYTGLSLFRCLLVVGFARSLANFFALLYVAPFACAVLHARTPPFGRSTSLAFFALGELFTLARFSLRRLDAYTVAYHCTSSQPWRPS